MQIITDYSGALAASDQTSPSLTHLFQQDRIHHWNQVGHKLAAGVQTGSYYHSRLETIYGFLISPDLKVLEVGCALGDLLAAVKPAHGVGVDFSTAMIEQAQQRHPALNFILVDAHELKLEEKFDVIILSDLINDLFDVQKVLERLQPLCHSQTRIIFNFYSRLWEGPLALATRLGLANANLYQNWLTVEDVANMLDLADFEVIRQWEEVLWPVRTPLIDQFCNRFLVKLWPFSMFALTNFIVARPRPVKPVMKDLPMVSVIIAARNEAGNIAQIFARVPEMGGGTEIVFVEGHSKDNTYEEIERQIAAHPERRCKLFRQPGKGKGDAVRTGFDNASGEILMILDADLTVAPEDLPRFYEALHTGKGDFINGVRLVYPMEKEAMRFFNLLGNKFFSLAFSWLLGQSVKDTLCGTKVLRKRDYERIAANRSYFGNFDPFGDFDLIFGAAKQGLKIVDIPIRYRERTYGTTNIQRWSHGWLLLQMVWFAARRIKFV